MNLRMALGFIREGDPDAWRCEYCGHWTTQNECYRHRVRVLRAPLGPRPDPPPMPPGPHPIEVRIVQ